MRNRLPRLVLIHPRIEIFPREEYYERLLAVTKEGAWEMWLIYFLRGVRDQAEDALARIQRINDLLVSWREQLAGIQAGRPEQVLNLFVENPFWTVGGLGAALNVAYTTARRAVDRLEEAGIVSLVGAVKRNRSYCARAMLEVLAAPHARGWAASNTNALPDTVS